MRCRKAVLRAGRLELQRREQGGETPNAESRAGKPPTPRASPRREKRKAGACWPGERAAWPAQGHWGGIRVGGEGAEAVVGGAAQGVGGEALAGGE